MPRLTSLASVVLVTLYLLTPILSLIPPVEGQGRPEDPLDNVGQLKRLTARVSAPLGTEFREDATLAGQGGFLVSFSQGFPYAKDLSNNITHLSIRQVDLSNGNTIEFICRIDQPEFIKCRIRGEIVTIASAFYDIGMEGGRWSDDSTSYVTPEYHFDFSDLKEAGLTLSFLGKSLRITLPRGAFDIDPTITTASNADALEVEQTEKAFTLLERDYVFYTDSIDEIYYQFKRPSETTWSTPIRFSGPLAFDHRAFGTNTNGTHAAVVRGRTASAFNYILLSPLGDGTLQIDSNTSVTHTGTAVTFSTAWNSTGYPIVSMEKQNDNMRLFRGNEINGASWFPEQDTGTGGSATFGVGTFVCGLSNGNVVVFGYQTFSTDTDFESRIWYASNQSFGSVHLVEDIGAVPPIFSGSCEGTTAHFFYTTTGLAEAHYANVTTGGNPSTPFTVITGTIDSLSMAADASSGALIFLTMINGKVIYNETSSTQSFIETGTLQTGIVGGAYLHSPRHWNVTATLTSLFIAYMNNSATINYAHWTNDGILVSLAFTDGQGTPTTPNNMTLIASNSSSISFDIVASSISVQLEAGIHNVTEIFRAGGDKKDNETSFYVDQAFLSFSFIVHNVTINLTFLDEHTLNPYTKVKVVDFFLENELISVNASTATSLSQGMARNPTQIRVVVNDGTTDFARWRQVEDTALITSITFYLPDYDIFTVNNYEFELLIDPDGSFTNGTLLTRRNTPVGLVTIDEQLNIDPERKIIVALIQGHQYSLRVISRDGLTTTDLGFFIPSTTLTKTLIVNEVAFSRGIELSYKFILWEARRNSSIITVNYNDSTAQTTDVTINIYNSTGLQFTTSSSSQSFSVTFSGASTNSTHVYWVTLLINHVRFGNLAETQTVGDELISVPAIDLGLRDNSPWYTYASVGGIIFVAGLFGAKEATAGTLSIAFIAAMFYFFGWLNVNPILIGVIMFLAFLFSVGSRKIVS